MSGGGQRRFSVGDRVVTVEGIIYRGKVEGTIAGYVEGDPFPWRVELDADKNHPRSAFAFRDCELSATPTAGQTPGGGAP